jgi:hypothetical protein
MSIAARLQSGTAFSVPNWSSATQGNIKRDKDDAPAPKDEKK